MTPLDHSHRGPEASGPHAARPSEEVHTMNTLEKRYADAIKAIGGTFGLLALPDQVKEALNARVSLETKVKMLELIAKQLGKMPR